MQPCSSPFQLGESPENGGQSGWPLAPAPGRVKDLVPAKSAEIPWCPGKISGPSTAKSYNSFILLLEPDTSNIIGAAAVSSPPRTGTALQLALSPRRPFLRAPGTTKAVSLMLRSHTAAMSWHLVVAVLAGFAVDLSAATDHIVGANHSWNPNISFRYQKGTHNVFEVNETGYDNCTMDGVAGNWTSGKDFIPLPEARRYYFICGNGFCLQGMKVAITVHPLQHNASSNGSSGRRGSAARRERPPRRRSGRGAPRGWRQSLSPRQPLVLSVRSSIPGFL
ncbi:hypothetical protein C2845_PM03G06060 [Panicum miliaceum]|uniref:Phytocyanin domain-containing protein n=1 Tax=Panicum miliaceum TaxID=4540 RepID=A0A3L6T912_PANMI|nr:hypothetical protein C2845_PM03G06060 [Panicum miliaceum]